MVRLSKIFIYLVLLALFFTGYIFLWPNPSDRLKIPKTIPSHLQTEFESDPYLTAQTVLNAFSGTEKDGKVTPELIRNKINGYLDWHMKDLICGHHYDMGVGNSRVAECKKRKVEFAFYKKSPRNRKVLKDKIKENFFYLMAFDENRDQVLEERELRAFIFEKLSSEKTQKIQQCPLPPVTDNVEVAYLASQFGAGISYIDVYGKGRDTKTVTLNITPGETEIYLIAVHREPIIWVIQGDVERVRQFVTQRTKAFYPENINMGRVGVTGLPASRVTFLEHGCIPLFGKRKLSHSTPKFIVETLLQSDIDYQISAYGGLQTIIPEGIFEKNPQIQLYKDQKTKPYGRDNVHITFKRGQNDGILDIDINDVISPGEKRTYEILPGSAGLVELVNASKIIQIGPKKFEVMEPIKRLPSNRGGYDAVFKLAPGVPLPEYIDDDHVVFSPDDKCLTARENDILSKSRCKHADK